MATETPTAELKRTPLHAAHVALGARMVPFGGWDMPVAYSSQIAEHHAVREKVGIFDVSHMGQVRFRGERAQAFLEALLPGKFSRLKDGDSLYTVMCTPSGGVIDDLIVTRVSDRECFAVVNAGTREGDVEWMRTNLKRLGFEEVEIEDESDRWGMIAVQGPEALALLERLIPQAQWTQTKGFTLHSLDLDGRPHIVSRTGYTGENGVELLCPAELAPTWWQRLLDAGAVPCGLGARDSLRLEMGYSLYGQDLSQSISPLEAGLSWVIDWKREGNWVGKVALVQEKEQGTLLRNVGLKTDSRKPLRHGDEVHADGQKIGVVTSGGFSPVLNCGIALALVDVAGSQGRETLDVVSKGKSQPATVVKPPFVQVKSVPVK